MHKMSNLKKKTKNPVTWAKVSFFPVYVSVKSYKWLPELNFALSCEHKNVF